MGSDRIEDMMLLEELIADENNYAHIAAAITQEHEVLMNTADACMLYSKVSHVLFVECTEETAQVLQEMDKHPANLVETTNEEIYQTLRDRYQDSYQCIQMVYHPGKTGNDTERAGEVVSEPTEGLHLQPLRPQELAYAQEHYEYPAYLKQLYQRGRVYGYYRGEELAGFVAHHIDESIGALYIREAYRGYGYGAAMISAMTGLLAHEVTYAQVLTDNMPSLKMHEKIQHTQSKHKICWMFNEPFSY